MAATVACGMLMGTAGGRVDADRTPADPPFRTGTGLDVS